MTKRGLGKGLGALLPPDFSLDEERKKAGEQVLMLPMDQITANQAQPRKQMEPHKLDELAASIEEYGVIQPIVVRRLADKQYEIVAGERRWRACHQLEWAAIPAMVKDYSEAEVLAVALIENIQREDLNPSEEANAYRLLIEEHGYTQEELARRIGKSRSFVSNMLRLLNLVKPVLEMLKEGVISIGHARALLALPEEGQLTLAHKVVREGLSVRETEALVKGVLALAQEPRAAQTRQDTSGGLAKPFVMDYQDRLREMLGTKVEINQQGEKGKIVIEYYSPEDLDRVLEFFFAGND